MTNAEVKLDWLIRHRGEPATISFLNEASKKIDAEIVKSAIDVLMEMEPENPESIEWYAVRKNRNQMRRIRRIDDKREHYRKIAMKKGA